MITTSQWWGSGPHKLYTVIVFIGLASLDNAAIGLLPPLYAIIGDGLGVSEAAIGLSTTLRILVSAVAALLWGYRGDQRQRKPLLLYGTLIWTVGLFLSGAAQSYTQLVIFQMITAVGIGCIGSIGFSVVVDFIPAARRGLVISLWGLAQGGGWGTGAMLASIVGVENWRWPFWMIAATGVLFTVLYLFGYEPSRGRTEPTLANLFEQGRSYSYQIDLPQIQQILQRPSNRWLILQGLIATVAYGSTLWMPRLFAAKIQAEGYSLEVATIAGAMFTMIFQTGGYFTLVAGYLGDRWHQRDRRGRAILSTIGTWGSMPFLLLTFLLPLRGLQLPDPDLFAATDWFGLLTLSEAVFFSVVSNGWVAATFMVALVGFSLSSIDFANRPALLTEVNLPEHRGTIVGLAILANGLGFALGNGLSGLTFDTLIQQFPPPLNYAIGLGLFQLFFIPAGYCYYRLIRTAPADVEAVQATLAERGRGEVIRA